MISRPEHERSISDQKSLAYVTCTISGEQVEPGKFTDYFNCEPDIFVEKDRPFRTPSGRLSSTPGRVGVWGLTTKHSVFSDSITPHLEYLVGRLRLPRPDLPVVLSDYGAAFRCSCYWLNVAGDRLLHIDEKIRELFEASGGQIEVDEYR